MSITTKTGDHGETSLLTGERVKKSGLRVDTYGTLDEVDSALGLARAFSDKDDVAERILQLQRKMPALMADFASCGKEPRITMEDVHELEDWCDDVESDLPEEHAFIIPGGSQSGAIVAAVILVCALGFNSVGGLTFAVGGVSINLSGLAIAAIVGILLNAILPGNDYEFDAANGSDAPSSANLQV